jgi:hypothetical protein
MKYLIVIFFKNELFFKTTRSVVGRRLNQIIVETAFSGCLQPHELNQLNI